MGTLVVHIETISDSVDKFLPTTASIIALGVYDIERAQGAVYYQGSKGKNITGKANWQYKERTEAQMLEDFWEGARDYDIFVTFNGRAYDLAFILHRSVHHGLKPTAELLGSRHLSSQSFPYHVDLMEELTFYSAIKKQSLVAFCDLYEIDYLPPALGGDELYQAGEYLELCDAVSNTVEATTELYQKWKQYLAPAKFINAIEF